MRTEAPDLCSALTLMKLNKVIKLCPICPDSVKTIIQARTSRAELMENLFGIQSALSIPGKTLVKVSQKKLSRSLQ